MTENDFEYTALLTALFIGSFFWAFGKKRKIRFPGTSFQDKP